MSIHPTAVIEKGADIAPDAEIGPFCHIGGKARIGSGTRLLHSVIVAGRATIGKNNLLHPYCVIGSDPQTGRSDGETETVVGDGNIIRECATINGGAKEGTGRTVVGNHSLIMATAHVGHDSIIEDECIMANLVLLPGHNHLQTGAILSGQVVVRDYVTLGRYSFVGGFSKIPRDVPPFMMAQGFEGEIRGINSVGLRRRGFKPETTDALREAHRILWRSELTGADAVAKVEATYPGIPEIKTLVEFLRASERGHAGRARATESSPGEDWE